MMNCPTCGICSETGSDGETRHEVAVEPWHVVVYGNPVNGFTFVGPFHDRDDAVKYAENEPYNDNWWIAELDAPAEKL